MLFRHFLEHELMSPAYKCIILRIMSLRYNIKYFKYIINYNNRYINKIKIKILLIIVII